MYSKIKLIKKSTRIEKTSEIHIHKNNLSVSSLSRKGEVYQVKQHILFVLLARKKERKLQTLRSLENNLFKNQSIQGKGQKKMF